MGEKSIRFSIDKKTVEFIRKKGGSVLITMSFEPSPSCGWRGDKLWGTFIPEIGLGKPNENSNFLNQEVEGITVWYPGNLKIKEGCEAIRIFTKGVLFTRWLEMEGAQGKPVVPGNGFEGT